MPDRTRNLTYGAKSLPDVVKWYFNPAEMHKCVFFGKSEPFSTPPCQMSALTEPRSPLACGAEAVTVATTLSRTL